MLLDTGRVPLTGARVSFENGTSAGAYMFLGRGGIHAAGTEWRLLKHLKVEKDLMKLDFIFPESGYLQYAFVADQGKRSDFKIDSLSGPDYYAYFQVEPGESYTLLCGYPDALSVLGLNTDVIEQRP